MATMGTPARDAETPKAVRARLAAEIRATVNDFVRKHGRRPRALCIGNCANNGYNNGKLLARAGWDIDVMCYDYYHIMGCPEWEDADFKGDVGDHFKPNWNAVDLRGFCRPSWFVQGPQLLCLDALLAKRRGQWLRARVLHLLARHWEFPPVQRARAGYQRAVQFLARLREQVRSQRACLSEWLAEKGLACLNWVCRQSLPRATPTVRAPIIGHGPVQRWQGRLGEDQRVLRRCLTAVRWLTRGANFGLRQVARATNLGLWLLFALLGLLKRAALLPVRPLPALLRALARGVAPRPVPEVPPPPAEDFFDRRTDELIRQFARVFPERADRLSKNDLECFRYVMPQWRELCSYYDVVIGYAMDGLYPLLSGKRPYVAYEHGTIRNIPFEDTQFGRICALVYHEADAVVITNCDNILAAGKLQLTQHRFIPHPINEDWLRDRKWRRLRRKLQANLQADFLVFHPPRQHWEAMRHPDWEKGNDIFLRGFARFVREVCPSAAAICVAWGKTLQESKDLIAELGITDRVLWIDPQPTAKMTRFLRAADVVADQFYLGAFGGIMPKAMVYGRPSLIYLNEQRHEWCFPEMPPVCNTRTPDEVFAALCRLRHDPGYTRRLIKDGLRWYSKYHSSEVVTRGFCDILRAVTGLDETERALRRSA